ncbi:flagellar assembly factor FliW [Andreesenia angusta]|uniref:Flagellar assembly factor FliW n=1 Tax=Andreesenia angusta TaxID=39480 RepID=A0A1S1V5U6_9FIRM|nr:flagellar assembly protein FliW [Andreesenia angusta]OHW61968.1 flagellar assembly factor FliW [Andreesenia angusta]
MEDKIITFKEGIPGFEDYRDYVLVINEDEENPFHKLQSVEEESIGFYVVNPFLIINDYDFELKESTIKLLEIQSEKDLAVLSIVKIPGKLEDMTVNLSAPIVINSKSKLGKQIVLDDSRYSVRHRIYSGETK